VCPTSNLKLGVVSSIEQHPIERLRHAGVAISVNTDDPALLDTCLEREYALCRDTFEWSDDDLWSVARTSIDASFANDDVKAQLRDALSRW
jgi:adenosine deaminase